MKRLQKVNFFIKVRRRTIKEAGLEQARQKRETSQWFLFCSHSMTFWSCSMRRLNRLRSHGGGRWLLWVELSVDHSDVQILMWLILKVPWFSNERFFIFFSQSGSVSSFNFSSISRRFRTSTFEGTEFVLLRRLVVYLLTLTITCLARRTPSWGRTPACSRRRGESWQRGGWIYLRTWYKYPNYI